VQSGLFRSSGLDVVMDPQHNGPSVMSGVIGSSYQFGKSSTPPLIAAYSKGLPFTIIWPAGLYDAVELLFLPSVYAPYPACHGARYNSATG
jgi:ABC-type nitrate/sulfonate/bicarbonate transport system substrate-binding protein